MEPHAVVASSHGGTAAGGVRTLGEWLTGREPPVPAALLSRMGGERTPVDARPLLDALGTEARAALRDARQGAGERGGAYRLLVADAYLTYACEVALTSEDPAAGLLEVVHEVVRESGAG
jgi:hypothetical protein